MAKCDKYIRLVTSILKTYRAFKPKTKLTKTYKELVTMRRVIRWEGKYGTCVELMEEGDSVPMKLFKIEQLVADLIDEGALWMTWLFRGTRKYGKVIEKLEQI